MTTYVYPADRYGCGYYRLIWPAQALQASGHNVKIVMPHERNAYLEGEIDQRSGKLVDVRLPPDADVVVLQRISLDRLVDAIPIIRSRGIAVVVDVDDDLAVIHHDNPAWHSYRPDAPPYDHSWRNVVASCRAATAVTVSADPLLRYYAPHGNGVVLHNRVPAWYLTVEHDDSPLVGWGGSVRSHPNDLQVVGHGVEQIIREGGRFIVVGPTNQDEVVRRYMSLSDAPECTGELDLQDEWPRGLARIGIGIAPLADTRFNWSKSWLKPLEMAAVGVPCVISPRAEYRRLNREGVGVLASSPQDWHRQLRQLVGSSELRAELSGRGREVAARHTIEEHAESWWNVWRGAAEAEAERRPPTAARRTLPPGYALGVRHST